MVDGDGAAPRLRGRTRRRVALRRPGRLLRRPGVRRPRLPAWLPAHGRERRRATITTIYPGWYSGRAVHIHFKIRTDPAASSGFEFTSQLFFDEAINDAVFAQGVYAAKGTADVRNENDGIYQQSQGMTLLTPTADGDGYAATFEIAINAA